MASETIANRLAPFDPVVEVGIGRRTHVAKRLAQSGTCVTATDIVTRRVPPEVTFVLDDITQPDHAIYDGAEAIYALNLPPELHKPVYETAEHHDTVFVFTTLGGDGPAIPARPEMIPADTLYWAREPPDE